MSPIPTREAGTMNNTGIGNHIRRHRCIWMLVHLKIYCKKLVRQFEADWNSRGRISCMLLSKPAWYGNNVSQDGPSA